VQKAEKYLFMNVVIIEHISILKERIKFLISRITTSRQAIRSVAALLSSNIASSLFTALGGLLVARFVGPELTGSFRAYTIPLTYLMFLHLGTFDGLVRQIPFYVGKELPEKIDGLAAAAGFFNIRLSVVVSIGFVVCGAYSAVHHNLQGVIGWLSQVICCWGVFYGGYLTSTYRTLHHFATLARIQMVQTMLTFAAVFSLPFLGFYGLCARAAFPSLLGVWLYHRNRPLKVDYHHDTAALKELIKIGFLLGFWGNLYTSVWIATESAAVLSLNGVSALGLYSVATVMAGAVNSLPMAVSQVLAPRVVTAYARDGSVRNANARIFWVTAGLTGFMILLACGGSLLLDVLVPLIMPKYVAGIAAMKICLWFPVVQATHLPLNTLFAKGRPVLYGRNIIAGWIVFAVTTYLLHPVIGGLLAVVTGSLLGRIARTIVIYTDLAALARQET